MPGVRSWNSVSFSLISLLTGAGTGSLPCFSWFVPRFPCVRSGGNNCFCYHHVVRSVVRALNARAQETVVAGNSVRPGILSPIIAQNLWSMCGRCYWSVVFLITCQISTDRLRSCKKYIKLDIGKTIIFAVVLFEPGLFLYTKILSYKTLNDANWKEDSVIVFAEDTFGLMCMLKAWVKINRQCLPTCIRLNSSLPVGIISWKTHCIIWATTFIHFWLDYTSYLVRCIEI